MKPGPSDTSALSPLGTAKVPLGDLVGQNLYFTLVSYLSLVDLQPVWCLTFSEQHFWNVFCISKLQLIQKQLQSSKETTSLSVLLMWLWAITSLSHQFRLADIFWETTVCWWQAFPYAISFFLGALGSMWETTWPAHPQVKVGLSIHPTFIPECVKIKWSKKILKKLENWLSWLWG